MSITAIQPILTYLVMYVLIHEVIIILLVIVIIYNYYDGNVHKLGSTRGLF